MNLKIIGLGLFSGDLSLRACGAIKKSDCVILKSEKFKSAKIIKDAFLNKGKGGSDVFFKGGAEFFVLDNFFEEAKDFDDLNERITAFVFKTSKKYKNTVYLTDGSGGGDATAAALIRMGAELIPAASAGVYAVARAMRSAYLEETENKTESKTENVKCGIRNAELPNGNKDISGIGNKKESAECGMQSDAENAESIDESGNAECYIQNTESINESGNAKGGIRKAELPNGNRGGLFSLPAVTEIGAYELKDTECLFPDKRFYFVVKDIDNAFTASDVKLRLSDIYGGAEVFLVYGGGEILKTTLFEIDGQKKSVYDYRTVLVIPPSETTANKVHDMADLYLVMKRLRGRGGCKWDMAQTHQSIAINAIEEAYELVDAIELSDRDKMLEESGDVLLQAVFHAVIAEDEGDFNVYDMLTALCEKLIFRHTHIFGGETAANEKEALAAWEKAKAKEKKYTNMTDKIKSVPNNFPALLRAEKIMKAAAKYGFGYEDEDEAFGKIAEKTAELRTAETPGEQKKKGGEMLLAAAECLRRTGVEPETALKEAVDRAAKRLEFMEAAAEKDGKSFSELTKEEREKYWNSAKAQEKNNI
ncbi:MAG: nucleoside triphosphate pyrophosphohydrolase [Clostridiales bacterium]|jgi:MazG family protein|nr:nucleoside triphosphate pyrophosphohydrolase [Clostridiales bacterium]